MRKYKLIRCLGKNVREHRLVAGSVIENGLPKNSVVHHIDNDGENNVNSNLIVCEDQDYHMLIHKRQRAYEACGNANYEKCWVCQNYDDVENLRNYSGRYDQHHIDCMKEYHMEWRKKRRGGV